MTPISTTTRSVRRVALTIALAPLAPFAVLGAQGTPRDTSLTLGQAARLAASQSAGTQAARYRTEQARARVTQTRAALLPTVSALASDGARTFNTASFGLDFPGFDPNGTVEGPARLWDFRGRVSTNLLDMSAFSRVRAAQSAERATTADATNQGELAATQAAGAYLRALRAEGQLHARVADSVLAADLLGIARNQLAAGTGVALDVTRAQSQVATTYAQLLTARSDRDRAQLELARALNLPLTTNIRLTDTLGTASSADAVNEDAAVARALANRPDLKAASEQLVAAKQQVSAIKAERLPTISAYADQGAVGKNLQHLLNTYDYGVQVSLPIFDGFRREGRLEEQKAVASELDVRRRDLEAQAAVEVRSAALDLRSAREQVAATDERVRLADQELSQARERFRAGVAGNADVITASLSLNAARTAAVDARAAYQTARVSFARAQGSITELP